MRVTAIQQTAPVKHRSYVNECNFCARYDKKRRRCALRNCFYDDGGRRNTAKRKARRDIEDAMIWHG